MSNGTDISLVSLKGISKPATKLIDRISDAIGGGFRPNQIRRIAEAEADAKLTLAMADIHIEGLQRRAMLRHIQEESIRQENIESITLKSLPEIADSSNPEAMDKDWISHFFDRARLISNDDMQRMWSKILAGEANAPGRFSRRTIDALSSLDKLDAESFVKLCHFIWNAPGSPVPIIWDCNDDFYKSRGINFSMLNHLESIGLINFNNLTGYINQGLPKTFDVQYFGESLVIECPKENENKIQIGRTLFTRIGTELCYIVEIEPIPEFVEYCAEKWRKDGLKVEKRAKV